MNKSISMRSLFFIAALFTLTSSFAQSKLATKIDSKNSVTAEVYPGSTKTRFILVTKNPYGKKISITLKNSDGEVFHRMTRKQNLRTIFDLSKVEDDDYTLTISSPGNNITKAVALRTVYAAATKTVQVR